MNNQRLKQLIATPVVSRENGEHLGQVNDLLVDTPSGKARGFAVRRADGTCAITDWRDVVSTEGPIVVKRKESLVWVDASPLNAVLRARRDLIGRKVTTTEGRRLGTIADVFVLGSLLIYEVYPSIWARLCGSASYFTGALSPRLAAKGKVLAVAGDAAQLHRQLEAVA
jgi:sporulation protein YlmC with PRC-barrel domain